MKRFFCLLLILSLLCAPLSADAENYQALQMKASQLLAAHQKDKAQGIKTPSQEKNKAFQAGLLFLQAATVAPDDGQKFATLESAGQAFDQSQSLGNESAQAFAQARDLTSIAGEERARVGLEAARRLRTRQAYEAVVNISGATPQQLAPAYHEIAATYLLEAKKDKTLYSLVATNHEKAAAQYALFDLPKADTEYGLAQTYAINLAPSATTTALVDRLYNAELSLPFKESSDSSALREAMTKDKWADALNKVQATERAVQLWQEIGRDSQYPDEQRESAWLKAAETLKAKKQFDQALAALDQAADLRADNYIFSAKIGQEMIAIHKAQEQSDKVLAVWEKLNSHPKITPARKEQNSIEQAKLLYELKRSTEAKAILDSLWSDPQRAGETIYDISILRAQQELNAGNPEVARAELDAGLARLKELNDPSRLRNLSEMSGRLHANQKEYVQAMAAFTEACRITDPYGQESIRPSSQIFSQVEGMIKQSLAERRYSDAESIVEKLEHWSVHPILCILFEAEVYAAKGDVSSARAAVSLVRSRLNEVTLADRRAIEPRIQAVEKLIP